MTYEIRLDEIGMTERGSSSTVLIAGGYDEKQSIHWGHAGHRGESRPIVTVKIGFLSITLDEHVIGKAKLKALHERWRHKPDLQLADNTTPENRRDAAVAAMTAGHYEMSVAIEPSVLTDMIVLEALTLFAKQVTPEGLKALVEAAFKEVEALRRDSEILGASNMKVELRKLLGISPDGSHDYCGPRP